jgi:hypothetical protein
MALFTLAMWFSLEWIVARRLGALMIWDDQETSTPGMNPPLNIKNSYVNNKARGNKCQRTLCLLIRMYV